MGCKLLEIMADGLYAVFHRFEAFLNKKVDAQALTVGCPSNGRRASSISALPAPAAQTSAGGTACSLLPAAGCTAAQASPPHRKPIAGLATPLLTHTCCYSTATAASHRSQTSEPSYCSPRGLALPHLPRLRVVPFLDLAVVHRRGALGAAWSMWSTTDFHRKSTVRGEADSWVHGSRKEVPPYYAENNYSSTCCQVEE